MEGEERKWGPGRLTNLQNELIWALLGSGLSREVLVQALEELEQERVTPEAEKGDRGDGESSEEGEMDFTPPIFQELEALPSEEAARQRALVDQLLHNNISNCSCELSLCLKIYITQSCLNNTDTNVNTDINMTIADEQYKNMHVFHAEFTNASHGLGTGEEQGEDIRKGRRNRFKWGPASQQILFHAYERQKNPSKEEREGFVEECNRVECLQRGVSPSQLAGLGSNLVTEVRVYNWFANRRKEETFRHKLALDTPYTSQSASTTNHTLSHSPVQGMKYSQQIPCASLGSARGRSGDRGFGGHLASPIQLEPSHTLLETHYHKLVSGGGPLPPVSTLTSLHSLSASPSPPQGLVMASLPSAMSLGESALLIGQTVPVINNMGGGFTTLQPISFQQQLTQQFQNHMGHSPFMATMTGLPCHMYSKSDMSPYPPSSLLSQTMVVTDSSSLGTLTSLSAVRQILTTDPEEETEPIQDDSLHLQSPSPVPGKKHHSGSFILPETHPPHLLSSSPADINSYIPEHMVSTAQ
uniref:HNF1 homeobox a n=1 Tax=Oncorhynchus kisutch TaxID=8019 RepID=A0A8C7N959_ONCKI